MAQEKKNSKAVVLAEKMLPESKKKAADKQEASKTGTSTNPRTKSQRKYDEANTRAFRMKLNKKTDKVVIRKLESVKSMQGYIKELILKDVRENGIGQAEKKTNQEN